MAFGGVLLIAATGLAAIGSLAFGTGAPAPPSGRS